VTFAAFVLVGLIPLLPFLLQLLHPGAAPAPFSLSAFMTGGAFFIVGALKGRFLDETWRRAGLETLAMGSTAAALAYLCGYLLKGLV
jgi:VIT1/CCC1 family predicted Fe2+/Mn2+ transporter